MCTIDACPSYASGAGCCMNAEEEDAALEEMLVTLRAERGQKDQTLLGIGFQEVVPHTAEFSSNCTLNSKRYETI